MSAFVVFSVFLLLQFANSQEQGVEGDRLVDLQPVNDLSSGLDPGRITALRATYTPWTADPGQFLDYLGTVNIFLRMTPCTETVRVKNGVAVPITVRVSCFRVLSVRSGRFACHVWRRVRRVLHRTERSL